MKKLLAGAALLVGLISGCGKGGSGDVGPIFVDDTSFMPVPATTFAGLSDIEKAAMLKGAWVLTTKGLQTTVTTTGTTVSTTVTYISETFRFSDVAPYTGSVNGLKEYDFSISCVNESFPLTKWTGYYSSTKRLWRASAEFTFSDKHWLDEYLFHISSDGKTMEHCCHASADLTTMIYFKNIDGDGICDPCTGVKVE